MRVKVSYFFLLFLLLSATSIAQKYTRNQFVVFSYSIDIDDRVKQELSPLVGQIDFIPVNKQDKVVATIVHTIYHTVTKTFEDSLGIFFLPPHSLSDKAKYTEYGYPDIIIQKAIRLSDTKYFMKIEASVENSKYNELGKKLVANEFVPVVNISISIYNKFGFNPIQTSEGQAIASKAVMVQPGFIAGMDFVANTIKPDSDITLKELMERAIFDALRGIVTKKNR